MRTFYKAAVQGAACGLMIGLVLLIGGRVGLLHPAHAEGEAASISDVVKARRFEVVDATGKARATLALFKDGTLGLVMRDAGGKQRASMAIFNDGSPDMYLVDTTGKALLPMCMPAGRYRPGMVTKDGNAARQPLEAGDDIWSPAE